MISMLAMMPVEISGGIDYWYAFDAVYLHYARRVGDRGFGGERQDFGPHRLFHQHPVEQGIGIFTAVRRRFGRGKYLTVIHRIIADDDIGQADGNHGRGQQLVTAGDFGNHHHHCQRHMARRRLKTPSSRQ